MSEPAPLPIIAVVGKKNSGKTTLLVGVAAELARRGLRVGSVKHAHHASSIDQEGTDSWRHFNEGGVRAVLLVADDRLGFVSRAADGAEEPRSLIERFFASEDYDLVLVEGYKHGPFPRIEVHRSGAHDHSVYEGSTEEERVLFLAVITDDPSLLTSCPTIPLDTRAPDGSHVAAVADLIVDLLDHRTHAP